MGLRKRLGLIAACILDLVAEPLVAPSMGPFTLGWERFLVVRQSAKFKPKLGGFEALAAFAVLPL